MSLAVKTTKGIAWSAGSQVARQAVQFVITAILARLLTPADFGLVGMITVITGFLALFTELGFGSAVVQRKDLTDEHVSTAFWVNIWSALALMLVTMMLAPIIAAFYEDPSLTPLTLVLAFHFPLNAFGTMQWNLLHRELDFRRLAVIEIVSLVSAGTVAIGLALKGFGAWSLIAQSLTNAAVSSLLAWIMVPLPPLRRGFHREKFNELFQFGSHLVGYQVLNYFARNLDNLLIGKFLGADALGYYSLAYRLMLSPLFNVSRVLGRVLFPAFSQIQHDRAKVRDGYLRAVRFISLVTFPMMAGMFIVAPELIRVVYGSRWERAIFLVQVLAPVGALQSIGVTVGPICMSQGRSDVLFKWGLVSVPTICLAIIVGLRWDIEGVAVWYAGASLSLWYVSHTIANRLIGLRMRDFILALMPTALAATVMAVVLAAVRPSLQSPLGLNGWQFLTAQVIGGVVIYFVTLLLVRPEWIQEFFGLAKMLTERTPKLEQGEP